MQTWTTTTLIEMTILQEREQKFIQELPEEFEHYERLTEIILNFSEGRWGQAKQIFKNASTRGQEAMLGGILYQQYGMAGRLLITLSNGKEWFSMIGALEGSKCHIQGIGGTLSSAISMIELVDSNWDDLFSMNEDLRIG